MIKPAFQNSGRPWSDPEGIILPGFDLERVRKFRILPDPRSSGETVQPVMPLSGPRYLACMSVEISTDGKETWSLLKTGGFTPWWSATECRKPPKVPKGEKDWGIRNNTVHLVSIEDGKNSSTHIRMTLLTLLKQKVEDWTDARQGKMCRLLVTNRLEFHCQGQK